MRLTNATKEELLAIPEREWNTVLNNVWAIYIIPTDREHDSGYAVINFVCEFIDEDELPIRCGNYCDDIELDGNEFQVDCTLPDKVIRIHNRFGFTVGHDLSSITLSDGTGRFKKGEW